MKKTTIVFLLIALSMNLYAYRAPRAPGFGLSIGDPNGLTYKQFISKRGAYHVALGYNSNKDPQVNVDYVYHSPIKYKDRYTDLTGTAYYFPIGAKGYYKKDRLDDDGNKLESDISLSARLGMGFLYFAPETDIETFFEVVPAMDLFPKQEFYFDLAIGVRYYFTD